MKSFCGLMAVAILCVANVAQAEDAQTSELPAALKALNGESAVVSTSEAEAVRGQGGIWIHGLAKGNTTIVSGVLLQATGKIGPLDVNVTAAGNHVKLWAGRNDVIANAHGKFTNTSIDFGGKFRFDFVWPKIKY